MYLQGFFVGETLVTDGTFETLLVRVGHLVGLEQVLVAESASAYVAEERLLVRLFAFAFRLVVDAVQGQRFAAAVRAEALALLEPTLARCALVRTLLRVGHLVGLEQVLVAESASAYVAEERLLVRLFAFAFRLVVDAVQGQRFAAAVRAEALALLEPTLARCALVRTLLRVQVHVLVQSALVSKRPVTRITCITII